MTDRRRKGSTAELNQEQQLLANVHAKVAAVRDIQQRLAESTNVLNDLQMQWNAFNEAASQAGEDELDDDGSDAGLALRDQLLAALNTLSELSEQEKSLAANGLDSLNSLMALQNSAEQPQLQVTNENNKRKKRRLDNASPAPLDTTSARASPAPASASLPAAEKATSKGLSRSLSVNTAPAKAASPGPEPTPSTASSSHPPTSARSGPKAAANAAAQTSRKDKKDNITAQTPQLPLAPGRPVAFKPPAKAGSKASKEAGSTDWILTRVVRCLSSEKNRYEVQDVDDAEGAEGAESKPGATYNTTLKHILLLPDSRDRTTYPLSPYPANTEVLALYPDTTSFYKATVIVPASGKRRTYGLRFEDDGDVTRYVTQDHVVEPPKDKAA